MKALDEILIEYLGAKHPVFNETGHLSDEGYKAYDKLESLLKDLNGIGISINADKIMNQIDDIINEN